MSQHQITLILAPLQGFTDLPFRTVFFRHFKGIDEAMAPFISTMGHQRFKLSGLRDVAPDRNPDHPPLVPQIMGNVADDFIYLADRLFDLGYLQVNWNLGCPHSKVAKKQRGSGLLLYPEKIDAILARVVPGMSCRLSVKIRLGRRNKDEIKDILDVLDRHDLDEIILHPRTGEQMYTGRCDLDAFEAAQKHSPHSFVYNGDITDTASFSRIRDRFPHIRRIMIGRGMLSNPFLAEAIKGMPVQDEKIRLERLRAFHDDLVAQYAKTLSGPGHLTGRMKGIWNYLGPGFDGHKNPLKKILKATTLPAYNERAKAFFDLELPFRPGRKNP
jgi:tRNA-dihydrouridine synthase